MHISCAYRGTYGVAFDWLCFDVPWAMLYCVLKFVLTSHLTVVCDRDFVYLSSHVPADFYESQYPGKNGALPQNDNPYVCSVQDYPERLCGKYLSG
jgi:hypothetical protein